MASNDKPVFFISSSMSELAEERAIVRRVVAKLGDGSYETFCFEEDAVAQAHSPQEEWRRQLGRTNATLGLLYQKLGQYTAEELRLSRENGIPVLLFRKKDKQKALERDAGPFMAWLEDAETGITAKYFKTPKDLKQAVKEALARLVADALTVAHGTRRTGTITVDGIELVESAAPKATRSSEPPNRLGRQRLLVGRDAEIASLKGAIERAPGSGKRHIVLIGPDGIGKQALLRYLTHSGELPTFRDGTAVYPNWKDRENLEDLRQALWEEFYDTRHSVDPRRRDRQLRDIEALVFLPSVDAGADIDPVVDDTMPDSVFCTSRTALSTPVVPIKVGALTDRAAMLAVFEQSYGPVAESARPAVVELCERHGGNPGKIEMLAMQALLDAPDDGDADAATRLATWATDAVLSLDVAPDEARALAVARDVGNVHTPRDVIADVAGSTDAVDRALGRGHLRAASPRYRLNPVLDPDDYESVLPAVFASTLRWIEHAPQAEIFANRAFVLRMTAWGLEQGRWAQVIALGRRAESSLAVGGRHGAWQELLEHVEEAARRVEPTDEVALGWALHQLGARSLLRDDLDAGRDFLFAAYRHRRDDEDARDLTRRNLKLLPAAVIPLHTLLLVPLFLALIVAALLQNDSREPNLDVDFGWVTFPTEDLIAATGEIEPGVRTGDAERFTVTIDRATINGYDVTVQDAGLCLVLDDGCVEPEASTADSVSVSGARLCPLVDEDASHREVDADDPCVLEVGFTPPSFGDFEARIQIVADDDTSYEGTLTANAVAAVVEVDPDLGEFTDVDETQSFTITNVGNVDVAIDVEDTPVRPIPSPENPSDPNATVDSFAVSIDCPYAQPLEPGDRCDIEVRRVGAGSGFLELDISATDDPGMEVLGDTRLLLVAP